jgi:hypothetical protein
MEVAAGPAPSPQENVEVLRALLLKQIRKMEPAPQWEWLDTADAASEEMPWRPTVGRHLDEYA